jgi:hypothetical protein
MIKGGKRPRGKKNRRGRAGGKSMDGRQQKNSPLQAVLCILGKSLVNSLVQLLHLFAAMSWWDLAGTFQSHWWCYHSDQSLMDLIHDLPQPSLPLYV